MAWYDDIGSFLSDAASTVSNSAGSLFDASSYGGLSSWQKAGLGLQLGSTLLDAYQQNQKSKESTQAIIEAARANAAAQQNQIDLQAMQLEDASAQQGSALQRQSAAQQATIVTQAGEAGISGAMLDRLLYAGEQDLNEAASNLTSNTQGRLGQLQLSRSAIESQAQSTINQAQAQRSASSPNWLGLGLQLGSLALGAASTSERQRLAAQQSATNLANQQLTSKFN